MIMDSTDGDTQQQPLSIAVDNLQKSSGLEFYTSDKPEYATETTAYWSTALHEILPYAVFQPRDSHQLSKALPVMAKWGCRLAVKCGGHMSTPHTNTARDGILISVSQLRHFKLDEETGVAEVGAGYRWGEVYEKLTTYGRTAVGGRYKDVGVSGFLLGGGISHLSNKYGLGADNVKNMEVVLANGEVVQANAEKNKDLFWALKGGSNNFGIVTRFDLQTIKQAKIWGGLHVVPESDLPQLLENINEWQKNGQLDENAAVIPSFIQGSALGTDMKMCSMMLYYGDAVEAPPDALKPFWSLPSIHSTLRQDTHYNFAVELAQNNSNTERHQFAIGTVKASETASQLCYNKFMETLDTHKLLPKIRYYALTMQPVSSSMVSKSDSPCADSANAPAIWWAIHVEYDKGQHDDDIATFCKDAYRNIQHAASECGLNSEYIFLNDAGEDQDVMRSYGTEHHKRLCQVSKTYDPERVFQRLFKGYKLGI